MCIGPDQVDLFDNLHEPFAGPLTDIVFEDILQAGSWWIDIIINQTPHVLDEEEIEVLMEDFHDYSELPESGEPGRLVEFMYGIPSFIEECYGCIPKHTN